MKNQDNHLIGKGVRDLCDGARSWCGQLEAVSATACPAGSPATAGPPPDLRSVTLWLINVIRQLIERLLAEETLHCETLAAVAAARNQRDAAFQDLRRQLQVFRQLGLSDGAGPLIPPGRLPRRPDEVAALAAAVHPRLDGPNLELPPGVKMLPASRQNLGWATAALAAASAAVEEALARSRKARETRDATSAALGAHLTAARSLHQAQCDLRTLHRAV